MERAVVGIIGCGNIARDVHFGNAFSNPRIHVKWCCDLDNACLEYVKSKYSPEKLTKDYTEVLKDPEVRGVLILTTHNVRESLIKAAAEAGKHIFVEKPLSTTPLESYNIMRSVRKNGIRLVVGFNRRRSPIVTDAYRILKKQQENPSDAPWRYKRYQDVKELREENSTMVLMRINDDLASFKSYAFDEFVGMGSIIGELCHFFDLAYYFIGKEPIKIYAEGWSRINMSVTILFEDLSVCTVFDSASGSFDHPKELIEIYHKGMSMQLDHYLQLRVGGLENIMKINYPFKNDPFPEITDGEGTNLYINKVQARNAQITDSTQFGFPEVDKGHYAMLDGFADCILLNSPSPCNELDGARATCMTLKARESIRTGMPVKISVDEYDYIFAD